MSNTDSHLEQSVPELVADLQSQINATDRSVSGLAKSIDSMQAACKMLLLYLENKHESHEESRQDDENKDPSQPVSGIAFQLLQLIEESVTDNKVIAFQNISTLLCSLSKGLIKFRPSSNEEQEKVELALDSYLAKKIPSQESDTGSYYDKKIQSLYFEIGKLKDIVKSQRHQIDRLNERESGLIEENDCLQRQVKQLEGNGVMRIKEPEIVFSNEDANQNERFIEKEDHRLHQEDGFEVLLKDLSENKSKEVVLIKSALELEQRNHADDVEKIQKEKKELEEKYQLLLTKLGDRLKNNADTSVSVQLFRPRGRNLVDGAFIERLRSRADQKAMKLYLSRCTSRGQIKLDNLLLILCECQFRDYVTDIFDSIKKEVEMSDKVGIVIFHMKNEKRIARSASFVRPYTRTTLVGGIFDIACDLYKNILTCDHNEGTFNEIMKFIFEGGVCQSDSVLHR